MNHDLFAKPISKTKVRKNVFAYRYENGTINIEGEKYVLYPVKEAIKMWRAKNPLRR